MNRSDFDSFMRAILHNTQCSVFLHSIEPAGTLKSGEAVDVYRNAYRVRLVDALGEIFSTTHWCLGDELFIKTATNYIHTQPSHVYNLSNYGEGFPRFLNSQDIAKEFPFLKDLADFEWQFNELFHERELTAATIEDFSKWHDFKIEFAPHLRIMSYSYGILNIWNAFKNSLEGNSYEAPNWQSPQSFMLYKFDHDLRIREISLASFYLLHFLKLGLSANFAIEKVQSLKLQLEAQEIYNLFTFLHSQKLVLKMCNAT